MKPPVPKSAEASFKLRNRDLYLQSSFLPPTGMQLEGDWKCHFIREKWEFILQNTLLKQHDRKAHTLMLIGENVIVVQKKRVDA